MELADYIQYNTTKNTVQYMLELYFKLRNTGELIQPPGIFKLNTKKS